mgnify:FL=1
MSLPSLRPPTLMIDLLFGALMLFAFQMGSPTNQTIIPHDFDLPTADKAADKKAKLLLPLKPISVGEGEWVYETPNGSRLSADDVAKRVHAKGETPVLLVASSARVQIYIDAEQPLRERNLQVALAVALEGD